MDQWLVNFETHSRDDVMKVCALLAKGIGKDTLSARRVQMQIYGGFAGGKTAITDGLVAAFADGAHSYKLSTQPLIEDHPGQAINPKGVVKIFNVNGKQCNVTLARHRFIIKDSFLNRSLVSMFHKPRLRGLDFVTTSFKRKLNSDIEIAFTRKNERRYEASDWTRHWMIIVKDKDLQNPEMAEIFDHLRGFHERRQARREQSEILEAALG